MYDKNNFEEARETLSFSLQKTPSNVGWANGILSAKRRRNAQRLVSEFNGKFLSLSEKIVFYESADDNE